MAAQAAPLRSRAEIVSPQAGKYLQQLCKHFQHKLPVVLAEASGQIAFDVGDCQLTCVGERLDMVVTAASEADLARLQDVVARHLLRFAFRETLQIDWQPQA